MSERCEEALANLYTYLDSELDDEEAVVRIQAHLEDCPPCGDRFHFESHLQRVVRERLQEEVPPTFLAKLREAIRHEGPVGG